MLTEWMELNNQEAKLKKKMKDVEADLDAKAYAQYARLTEDDVKTLVVDDKWLAALDAAIHGEIDRISQGLTHPARKGTGRTLRDPLPQMASRVAELEAKVNCHLAKMGFSINGEWRVEDGSRK